MTGKEPNGDVTDEQWQQAWAHPQPITAGHKQTLLAGIHQRIAVQQRRKKWWLYLGSGAVAAVLVAAVVKFTWFTMPVQQPWLTYTAGNERRVVKLPDSSTVWLAPHASLRIHPAFVQHRAVVLEAGMVFFSVTKDKMHPFTIAASRQQVTVLGTQFSVHIDDSTTVSVLVKEGRVALDNQQGRTIVHTGEQVTAQNTLTCRVQRSTGLPADWWLHQQVRLYDIPLGELLDRLSAYYRVTLSADTINRSMKKITLTWDQSQPLDANLAVLRALTGYPIH